MNDLEDRQRLTCERFGAAFSPPRPEQLCAVSVGVFDGDSVQGVRYHAPSHMSGWYLTTARYNGDHQTLTVEHVGHLIESRPDVAELLALPPGFRFELGQEGAAAAWFDPNVAQQS